VLIRQGVSNYMFDPKFSHFSRGLSLYHGWLPFVLLRALSRLGYDRRALLLQTLTRCWAENIRISCARPTRMVCVASRNLR